MKRKILLTVLTISLFTVISLVFTACGEHKHTYSDEWFGDSYYHWHEATCGHDDEISNIAEHSWDSGKVTVEATCNAEGVMTYTCTDCGKTKNDGIAKLEEHNWDSGKVTIEATCNAEGVMTYTCKDCGKTKNDGIAKLNEHNWNDGEITTPSTCTTKGVKTFVCDDCGEEKCEFLSALGHIWDEGALTTQPTCLTLGLMTFTCAQCSETKKEIIDANKNNHVYGEYEINKELHLQTCRLCGNSLKANHGFDGASKESDVDMVLECECGINTTVGEFYSYKVIFECDDGATVLVYKTQDYSVEGLASSIAYSRDSETGELLNDGNGQVNFSVNIAKDYWLDKILIEPSSGYKNLKGKEDTGSDSTFRITKISHDLTVKISIKTIANLENFGSFTDENGVVTFTWDSNEDIKYVNAQVRTQGVVSEYKITNTSSWTYNLVENFYSDFKFTPYTENDVAGETCACSRYYNPAIKMVAFPKIEITTWNYVFPSCDYVSAPSGYWGQGTTNKDYVQCILNLYNSNNELLYHSDNNLSQADAYTGAKIKVRGNTSAYSEKKPYKIKLNKKYDLLSSFYPDRTDKQYADKEWLLLNTGTSLNQLTGWSVSSTLQTEYTPAYLYVELYMNGDYRGLYILCESVKQGNGSDEEQARCAVSDTGYVIEMDAYWWNEDLYFTTPYIQGKVLRYTFKYPDSDDINKESPEYLYIQSYISDAEEALCKNDDTYLQYIDEESFVKWVMGHDILGTADAGGSNIYLTKFDNTEDSFLKMGPLWDFDSITINGAYDFSKIRNRDYFYYQLLTYRSSFIELYAEIFKNVKDKIIVDLTENIKVIDSVAYNTLIAHEHARWDSYSDTFENQRNNIISWLEIHLDWMTGEVLGPSA